MADIAMNHCALVDRARVAGAMVADAADNLRWHMLANALESFTPKKRTKKKMANSKLRAFDASFRKLIKDGCKAKDEDAAAELHRRLSERFEPEELKEIEALLEQISGAAAANEEGERADGDGREAMRDHDDYAEDDPETGLPGGGRIDRVEGAAEVGRVKSSAMDERARVAFDQRFPSLAGVTTDHSIPVRANDGVLQYPRKSIRRTTAADRARFRSMFPNLPGAA
jgi:hypothetical protein